jgi:DNA-binding transcriptional ArsR family regulator
MQRSVTLISAAAGNFPGELWMRLDNTYAFIYIYIIVHTSVLQALADPTRLHIIAVLRDGERSVNDIVGSVDIDQSGVSRHLRILQETGFVRVRPEGQKRFYSLCAEPFKDLDSWLSQYRQLWEGRLKQFGEALTRKREEKTIVPQKSKLSRRELHESKSE